MISVKTACAATIPGFGATRSFAAGASFGDLFPEKPTASITNIDSESGIITAKESSSGLTFTFKLTNPFLLKSLTVGQPLFVNMKNKWVSIEGSRINGNIITVGDGAKRVDSAEASDEDESDAPGGAAKPAAGANTSKISGSKQAGKPAKAGAGSQAAASGGASPGASAGNSAPPPDSEGDAGAADAATDEQPASPADAASPAGIADKAKQLAGVDAGKSMSSADMAKPSAPADAQPGEPADAATPAGSVDGAQPVVPTPDGQSVPPVAGTQPVAPVAPAQPAEPVGSAQSVTPVLGARPGGARLQGSPCQITNVDSGRGLITARENQTGRTFQFRLADASLVRSLNVGQAVTVDFAARRVSLLLNGQTVSGSIVSLAPPAAQR